MIKNYIKNQQENNSNQNILDCEFNLLQITASDVWRGHEQQIIYYYEEFQKKGINQILICIKNSPLHKKALERNFKVYTLPFSSEYSLSSPKFIKKICDDNKIDIILIHNSDAHTMCVTASCIYGLKLPLVIFRTLAERVDTNFFRKWKYNYHGIKKIVCVSNAVKNVLKYAVKDWSRFEIVESATDLEQFYKQKKDYYLHKELKLDNSVKLIGYVAAFEKVKNHILFLEIAKSIIEKTKNIHFVLVGKGKLYNEIKNNIADNLKNNIHFLGFRNDISLILPEFDILLFTSKNEASGGVIIEANCCNVPVVASNAGGIPEVIINNETGILCNMDNHLEFENSIMNILNDKDLHNKLTKNALNRVKNLFTKEIIANKMFEILKSVLNNSK